MRLAWLLVGVPVLLVACATGVDTTGAGLEPDTDSGSGADDAGSNPYSGDSGSRRKPDAAQQDPDATTDPSDAAKPPPADSAPPLDSAPPIDSAPPPPPPVGDCTGTIGQQIGIPYDTECDNYFFNSFGTKHNCTPGANNCAAMNSGGTTFCCFISPPGSYCAQDYNNVPQCLPK